MSNKEFLTEEMFKKLGEEDKYFTKQRWAHYEEILKYLKMLDGLMEINNILEIGPYKAPFVVGSDIMDIKKYDYPIETNNFIEHNCSKTPLPIEDKKYDLVIASQVLEHLGIYGEQVKVFDELERICNMAIITLPYDWNVPNFRHHHRIDEFVFDTWASNREYIYEEIIGEDKDHRIILRIYNFE